MQYVCAAANNNCYNTGMFGLSKDEEQVLKQLKTPQKIQDFLDALPINFEKKGDTHYSPRRVLREQKAHCIEGALVAATALWLQGERPLLLDLKTRFLDDEHVETVGRCAHAYGVHRGADRTARRCFGHTKMR